MTGDSATKYLHTDEASYFQRMIFGGPLDIHLRSDCLAGPLLFIGYTLHDINIRCPLYRLKELLEEFATLPISGRYPTFS